MNHAIGRSAFGGQSNKEQEMEKGRREREIALRIEKVGRYIEQHLDQELSLNELAEMAHFSPFHFQRVFKAVTGETPKQLIKRLRLENAAHMIILFPEKNMLELALDFGFSSLEAFSRAFKNYYTISPNHFKQSPEDEKIRIVQHPRLQKKFLRTSYTGLQIDPADFQDMEIAVLQRPEQRFVYRQCPMDDPLLIRQTFQKVQQWASIRALEDQETRPFGLIKDYPLFTSLDKCRYLCCVPVNAPVDADGQVLYQEFPARTYARFEVQGGIAEVIKAVGFFAHYWLPESGYRLDPQPVSQTFLTDPCQTPFEQNRSQVFIRIAVG